MGLERSTTEYRGVSAEAEARAGAYRYGAHCAGVTAPTCSLGAWLPRKSSEPWGGPPGVRWHVTGTE